MAAFLLLEAGVKNISDSSGSRCVSVAGSRCEVLKAEAIAASAAVTAAAAAAAAFQKQKQPSDPGTGTFLWGSGSRLGVGHRPLRIRMLGCCIITRPIVTPHRTERTATRHPHPHYQSKQTWPFGCIYLPMHILK